MGAQLDTFKRNLKDHIHGLNKKNIKVVEPSLDLRGMTPGEIWGTDPVNPTEAAMAKIADGILLMAAKLLNRQQDNQQSAVPRGGGNTRRRGGHRGGGYRGGGRGGQSRHQEYYDRQDYNNQNRGRWHDPLYANDGRGHRGGHRDNRARPY
jgi:hypothetical protein